MNQTNPSTTPKWPVQQGSHKNDNYTTIRIGKNCKTIKDLSKLDNFCHLWAQDEKLNTKKTTQDAKLIITSIFTKNSKIWVD
jgi:hypothetical protein